MIENLQGEIWKDIPNYVGLYQASNLGRIKMLYKEVVTGKGVVLVYPEKIMRSTKQRDGYLRIGLTKNKARKLFQVHQLIAMAFLGHIPCGHKLVVDHKNYIRDDNRFENLKIKSQRENTNQKHLKSTSKYVGVYWNKQNQKWGARIWIKGKRKFLGYFDNEYNAHLKYQEELKQIQNETN